MAGELWRDTVRGGGWATAALLLLIAVCQILLNRRRHHRAAAAAAVVSATPSPAPPNCNATSRLSNRVPNIITEADLKVLISSLEGHGDENEKWEDVIHKKNNSVSYTAKCCRPKEGPLKYISVTVFEGCTPELLRDFYMDNDYRKEWDRTVTEHKQLQVDESSGIEIGLTVKKFPLLTPREYVLAWRVWEGKDGSFYCFVRECKHPLAPRRRNYVRVELYRSGWLIRKVHGRDACEIALLHQEDAGMNVEMAKLAFAKGIWNYVGKMDNALRRYSSRTPTRSASILTLCKLIQKVPPALDMGNEVTSQGLLDSSSRGILDIDAGNSSSTKSKLSRSSSKKWITNGLLVIGGVIYLSRGRSTLGTQLAVTCILKKLMKRRDKSGASEHNHVLGA